MCRVEMCKSGLLIESKEIDKIPNNIKVKIDKNWNNKRIPFDVENLAHMYYLQDDCDKRFSKIENKGYDKKIRKTCKWVEDKIYNDSREKDWRALDVFRILAWKTGKINYCKSRDSYQKIQYYANWDEGESRGGIVSLQIPYQNKIEWKEFKIFADKIIELRRLYCEGCKAIDIWESLVKSLEEEKIKRVTRGIGTVYLITLLHFITGGEYPIYDRFAMAGLVACELEKKEILVLENSTIRGCILPGKNESDRLKNILGNDSLYKYYCNLLEEIFPNKKWRERKVDQALWVYGHYFNVY